MSILRMILREIQHRKLNFLVALVAVWAAVALVVAVRTMCDASRRETTRLMRDMGFNVLILPKDAQMDEFWSDDYAKGEMPERYVHELANSRIFTVRHLWARLQKKIDFRGRAVLLTGVLPEVPVAHRPGKSPMVQPVPPGEVHVGFQAARGARLREGDEIDLAGRAFRVSRIVPERGSKDDIRIFAHLHDVQEVLDKPGVINEIRALSCRCPGEHLAGIRNEITGILPHTQVTEFSSIAVARAETREMVERYASFILPAVVAVSGVLIAMLALANVRDRREEIGILRAMGVGGSRVAALFMGKAAALGATGALAGFATGAALARAIGPSVFPVTAGNIGAEYNLLMWVLPAAPVLCMLASFIPAMEAVAQDPAAALRRE